MIGRKTMNGNKIGNKNVDQNMLGNKRNVIKGGASQLLYSTDPMRQQGVTYSKGVLDNPHLSGTAFF